MEPMENMKEEIRSLVQVDPGATLEELREALADPDGIQFQAEYVWDHLLGEPDEVSVEDFVEAMTEAVQARIAELESR